MKKNNVDSTTEQASMSKEMIMTHVIEFLADSNVDAINVHCASSEYASEAALLKLAQGSYLSMTAAFKNPKLTHKLVSVICNRKQPLEYPLQLLLLKRKDLTTQELEKVIKAGQHPSESEVAVKLLVCHPAVTTKLLREYVTRSETSIRTAIAKSNKADKSILATLLNDSSIRVKKSVQSNPLCDDSVKFLAKMMK